MPITFIFEGKSNGLKNKNIHKDRKNTCKDKIKKKQCLKRRGENKCKKKKVKTKCKKTCRFCGKYFEFIVTYFDIIVQIWKKTVDIYNDLILYSGSKKSHKPKRIQDTSSKKEKSRPQGIKKLSNVFKECQL